MYVIDQPQPAETPIPGVRHATWAGSHDGLQQLSLWRQTIAPGGATPPHSHDCEELVMCSSGCGELHVNGTVQRFGQNQTLLLPRDVLHQIVNSGSEPLETVAVFGATPVQVFLPSGEKLDLPWRS